MADTRPPLREAISVSGMVEACMGGALLTMNRRLGDGERCVCLHRLTTVHLPMVKSCPVYMRLPLRCVDGLYVLKRP
jgi:hypothetical protein